MQAGRKELIEDRLWGLGEDAIAVSDCLDELMVELREGTDLEDLILKHRLSSEDQCRLIELHQIEREREEYGAKLAEVLADAARGALMDCGYPHLAEHVELAMAGAVRKMVAEHRAKKEAGARLTLVVEAGI